MSHFKNSYKNYDKVVLESIQDSQIDDENLEPQFVRIRSGNFGNFYIGSTNTEGPPINPSDIIISANSLATRKIRRLGVSSVLFSTRIPNVNPTNNVVSFFSTVTAQFYSVTLTTGFYTTPALLVAELITKLNTVTGSSGITFSSVVNAIDANVYSINAVGGNYYFDPNSLMAKNGLFLINLNKNTTPAVTKTIGPIQLVYTRYIDVVSNELTKYDKNPSASTDSIYKAGNILRIFLFSDITNDNPNPGGPYSNYYTYENIRWLNYNRSQSIGPIDLKFFDENGNYLYIPNYGNSNTSTSFWVKIVFMTEL